MKATESTIRLHHIGVETSDLTNSLAWYRDFFGCRVTWSAQEFSELTRSRLPGVSTITEMVGGDLRFHLFERDRSSPAANDDARVQFQHVCVAVESSQELRRRRATWLELFGSGAYAFLCPEPPTEIVVDDRGVESFYCLDVNGLEFEFTYVPEGAS